MAGRELLKISKDENERARMISEYKFITDTQSKVVHARREGEQIGEKRIIDLLRQGVNPAEIIAKYGQ